MKLEIFLTPSTSAADIADSFPKRDTDRLVDADEKNGVVTLEVEGNAIPDPQIQWIEQQKEQGKIDRVETA